MAKAPNLTDLTSQYSAQSTVNDNNEKIEEAFRNTLSRDGSTPNQMEADLDMNSNDIGNVRTLQAQDIVLNGGTIEDGVIAAANTAVNARNDAEDYADDAEASAQAAQASADSIGLPLPVTSGGTGVTSVIEAQEVLGVNNTIEAFANVKDYGAKGDGVTQDRNAIQAALNTGKNVYFPKGDYVVNDELEIVNSGQIIQFENLGGYGYGEDIGFNWIPNTRIIAKGTFPKRIRTRRKYRASASDPQDDPISVVFNVQAESVVFRNVCLWLDCDYSDFSPTNLGSDCDVGIFVGTRVSTQFHDCQVIGYFRQAGVYIDVSGHTELPRFPDLNGNEYPEGTVKNGVDGTHLFNVYIRGPRRGLAVLGALPAEGELGYTTDYYDEISGQTIRDKRGSFGASDFLCVGGRIYGPDHHSDRRLFDPLLGPNGLSNGTMGQEPDDAPCAVHISGLAGNSSGNIWGMRFIGTRIATFEAFRVRLRHASRVSFFGVHVEGRNGGRMDTAGNVIDTNDYVNHSYGDVAALRDTVDRMTVFGSVRQTPNDMFPHFYNDQPYMVTDSGRTYLPNSLWFAGEADYRSGGNEGHRWRNNDVTIMKMGAQGPYAYTTADPANLNISSDGTLRRSTSARKYKTEIEPITDEALTNFLKLEGITYRSVVDTDDQSRRFSGFVADQAHELGLYDLVEYDEDGEIEGFAYDRATAYLFEIIKRKLM